MFSIRVTSWQDISIVQPESPERDDVALGELDVVFHDICVRDVFNLTGHSSGWDCQNYLRYFHFEIISTPNFRSRTRQVVVPQSVINPNNWYHRKAIDRNRSFSLKHCSDAVNLYRYGVSPSD